MTWLAEMIKRLEAKVDVLIIDQLDNGGGYVESVNQLARLFAHDKNLEGGTIDIRLSDRYLNALEQWGQAPDADKDHLREADIMEPRAEDEEESSEFTADRDSMFPPSNFTKLNLSREALEKLRKQQAAGKEYSGPLPNFGTTTRFHKGKSGVIVGRPGYTFSKKVLILNNAASASGGDMFPALLQANGRAYVFGENSAGLGGPLHHSHSSMPPFGMFMRSTLGYSERPDGLPMENIGTVPDFPEMGRSRRSS